MNRKLFIALAILLAFHPPLLAAGNLPQPALPAAATQPAAQPAGVSGPAASPARETAWLGVVLANVPDVLFTQLEQVIPPGQGVLVEEVVPDSPATLAGIQVNDVLLAYDDQKLFSPRQLAGLIRADRPGRTVAIQAIQHGQKKMLNVTLGKQELAASLPGYQPHGRYMPMMPHRHMPKWPPFPPPGSGSGQPQLWDQFESVDVHTLPDGRYHAAISYKDDKKGDMKFTFEGTQDEIRDEIRNNTTLPDDKKQALLQALNLNPDGFFDMPMLGNNPLNAPFFHGYPFEDDFFRDFPRLHMPPGYPSYSRPSTRDNGTGSGGDLL